MATPSHNPTHSHCTVPERIPMRSGTSLAPPVSHRCPPACIDPAPSVSLSEAAGPAQSGFHSALVHQPIAEAVIQVVKSEALPVRDLHSHGYHRDAQVVFHAAAGIERHFAFGAEGRKNKIRSFRAGALSAPVSQVGREQGVHGNVAVRDLGFRLAVLAFTRSPLMASRRLTERLMGMA
jgi:hypothetical protein